MPEFSCSSANKSFITAVFNSLSDHSILCLRVQLLENYCFSHCDTISPWFFIVLGKMCPCHIFLLLVAYFVQHWQLETLLLFSRRWHHSSSFRFLYPSWLWGCARECLYKSRQQSGHVWAQPLWLPTAWQGDPPLRGAPRGPCMDLLLKSEADGREWDTSVPFVLVSLFPLPLVREVAPEEFVLLERNRFIQLWPARQPLRGLCEGGGRCPWQWAPSVLLLLLCLQTGLRPTPHSVPGSLSGWLDLLSTRCCTLQSSFPPRPQQVGLRQAQQLPWICSPLQGPST